MATRIGVDVGGTFTDLIFYDEETGRTLVGKVPTDPIRPEKGVIDAVKQTLAPSQIATSKYFLHGTTVGLNALLERQGAKLGLLATEGFRDVIEIRRGDRADMYDPFWHPEPPLVPRHLRRPIRERISSSGAVIRPLVREDVAAAALLFVEQGVQGVAVAFINSYRNPEHERLAAQLLRDAGYDGPISLSCEVSGEYREYERTKTVIIDAFVRERVSAYLGRLSSDLENAGFPGQVYVTRSGGGSMSLTDAARRPFETVMSGPVAGVQGAARLSGELGLDAVITADVGGTSFDAALVAGGTAQLMYEGQVLGFPVQAPWVDVRSIGAGGGSIAFVDEGGLLRVGPRSAGSIPGPACYGRGGAAPTVTDAAFLLGMLGPGRLASGLLLDRPLAEAAVRRVAEPMRLSIEQAAIGIVRIVVARMADLIREITIEQGLDPRSMALMPFGGFGPGLALLIAEDLGVGTIVVPPYAGNFSAFGLIGSDPTLSASRTRILPATDGGLSEAAEIARELFATLDHGAETRESLSRMLSLDMRYQGQEHSLTIRTDLDLPGPDGTDALAARFEEEHERIFGIRIDARPEIVAVRATVTSHLPRHRGGLSGDPPDGTGARIKVLAYSFAAKGWRDFVLIERLSLCEGAEVEGPALVSESTTLTYLDVGHRLKVARGGSLVIVRTR